MTTSSWGRETIVIVEIDFPQCTRLYGDWFGSPTPASGCQAVLGVNGVAKCFNSLATCQDQANFNAGTLTLRFARAQSELARYYGLVRPSLMGAPSTTPSVINLGGMDQSAAALGQRESVTLVFSDHLDSDLLLDKYRLQRQTGEAMIGSPSAGYDSYNRGTFWGKLLARYPYHIGYALRLYEGFAGQDLAEMRVRHYVIDSIKGPNNGQVQIVAKDAFALVELSKAVVPAASRGELSANLAAGGTSFTLSPAGIGNSEYAASGYVAIGDEIIQYTRSGDAVTVVARGALGTTAAAHDDDDLVQQVAVFSAGLAQNHIYTLLTQYTAVGASRINAAQWTQITAAVSKLYSAYVAKPTPVEQLIGELEIAAGLTVWPDVSTGMIKIAVLRAGVAIATVSDEAWIRGDAVSLEPLVDKRASQVHVYYGQKNPLVDLKDKRNYHSRFIPAFSNNYSTESLREVFSRWIPQFAREHAQECANRLTTMFRDPPKQASFAIHASRDGELDYAQYFHMSTRELQDQTGARDELTSFATVSIERGENSIEIVGQSVRFSEEAGTGSPSETVRNIFIENNAYNLNLRTIHDSQFAAPTGTERITFTVLAGVTVGSTSTSSPAMRTGTWPAGVTLTLVNSGRLQGKGGNGGRGGDPGNPASAGQTGQAGGDALLVERAITITNNGEIWGGAGGGGGGAAPYDSASSASGPGGGGGAGAGNQTGAGGAAGNPSDLSNPAQNGSASTPSAGGSGGTGGTGTIAGAGQAIGGRGGDGGGPGLDGSAGSSGTQDGGLGSFNAGTAGAGGTKGKYVSGDSFVTWLVTGDRRGGVA